jgi:hypothetical protein
MVRPTKFFVATVAISIISLFASGARNVVALSNSPMHLMAEGSEPIPEPLPIPPLAQPQYMPELLAEGSEPIPEPLPIPPLAISIRTA